jgi:predicted transcriptional regulator
MAKSASLTVRIPEPLKKRIEARAEREHRSLSAQVEHELAQLFAAEHARGPTRAGRLLGRYAGRRVPTAMELREVRESLWSRLAGEER